MHLAKKLNRRLKPLYDTLRRRRSIRHADLHKLIQRAIRPFNARVMMYAEDIETDDCGISGLFEPQDHHRQIKLEVHVSKYSDILYLSDKLVKHMIYAIFQSMSHELIHQYQYRYRDDDATIIYYQLGDLAPMTDHQKYIAEVDEIDAYAHDIAIDLTYHYPGSYLDIMRNGLYMTSLAWKMYEEAFHGCEWRDIHNRLLKKTYQHIARIRDKDEGFTCLLTFSR